MKRIVVSNIVSLDGYFEGPDIGVMDLNMDGFFDAHNLECFEIADTVLVGAASYLGFSGYHTTVIARDQVARWKEDGDAENVVVFASHIMWNGLLVQGLVDELHLMVGPAALGGGTAAFEAPASLVLQDTRRSDGSDNVLLVYAPS
jgi:hypothetical protein